MVKKRQKKHRKPAGPKDLSTERLARKAEDNLNGHCFKAAVADYKELARREPTPEHLEALALAYEGRAEELAAKGMLKEALTIWKNRGDICGKPLGDARYLELLIETGDRAAAASWLSEHMASLSESPQALAAVRRLCAARILGGVEELLTPWPEDDQLRKDLPAAETALEAYCVGNDRALEQALGEIPFRSPFRELKPLFNALTTLLSNPSAALRHLDKLDAASPFQALAEAIRRGAQPARLTALEHNPIQAFANTLRGQNHAMTAAAADFGRVRNNSDYHRLLGLIAKHRQALGEAFAVEAAKRLLIHDEVHGEERVSFAFARAFGRPSQFEQERITALMEELDQMGLESILGTWRKVANQLDKAEAFPPQDQTLVRALILRHMADLALEFDNFRHLGADYLDDALKLDPEDRAGHILLIGLYRDLQDLKKAREIANRAEQRWPEDPGILTQSVRNAIASGAFQKAARISRQVLERDPVNSEIKGILFDAHLAHARKQISGGKAHLAQKELEQAAAWAAAPASRGRIDLLRGMTAFLLEDKTQAKSRLAAGCEALGSLAGRFVLSLEAFRLDLDPKALMRAAGIRPKPGKIEPADLLTTAAEIDLAHGPETNLRPLRLTLQGLMPSLKAGAKLPLSESQWIRLCETWLRVPELRKALLPAYAEAAARHYPRARIIQFFVLESRRNPDLPMDVAISDGLGSLMEEAQDAGDNRLAGRIKRLLIEDDRRSPRRGLFPFFDDEDDDEDDQALPESLDQDLPLPRIDLPPGVSEDQYVDMLLSEEIPPEIRLFLDEINLVFGGTLSDRDLLKVLFFHSAPPKPQSKKKRGRRKK